MKASGWVWTRSETGPSSTSCGTAATRLGGFGTTEQFDDCPAVKDLSEITYGGREQEISIRKSMKVLVTGTDGYLGCLLPRSWCGTAIRCLVWTPGTTSMVGCTTGSIAHHSRSRKTSATSPLGPPGR